MGIGGDRERQRGRGIGQRAEDEPVFIGKSDFIVFVGLGRAVLGGASISASVGTVPRNRSPTTVWRGPFCAKVVG